MIKKLVMMTCVIFLCVTASAFAQLPANGALNGNGQWQDGEVGNKLGATAAAALGLPGAQERLDAQVHDPGMPYGPPAPLPEEYGPNQFPEPGPAPVPQGPPPD